MEVPLFDAVLERGRFPASLPAAGEGMHAFHQQLVEQHREAETVVRRRAVHAGEVAALEFRRGVFGLAHRAAMHHAVGRGDLKGIAVPDRDEGVVAHGGVGFIEVADDVAAVVEGMDGGGKIFRGADQITPRPVRQQRAAFAGMVDVGERLALAAGHEKTGELAVGEMQQVRGPGDGTVAETGRRVGGRIGEHGLELAAAQVGLFQENLGDEFGMPRHFVNAALAALREEITLVQGDRAKGGAEDVHGLTAV